MLALDFDANGTPNFFINGHRVSGAQPIEAFINAVEPALAHAKELVASGVPPNKVYDKILEGAEGPPELEKKPAPPITAQNPTRGPVNAPVVIHEFADFQCPFCKRVEPTIRDLDRAYPGKIRWVWHNLPLPFHQNADPAANAAMEAFAQRGAGGFWAMHDLLFDHQEGDGLARAGLEECARKLGLDAKRFASALDGSTHRAEIGADQAIAGSAGITGTPAFIINGYFVSGAQPLPMFRRVVQRALENLNKPRAAPAKTP
jgi:protein-disulfide isomerase